MIPEHFFPNDYLRTLPTKRQIAEVCYISLLVMHSEEMHEAMEYLNDYEWEHKPSKEVFHIFKIFWGTDIKLDDNLLLERMSENITPLFIANIYELGSPGKNVAYYRQELINEMNTYRLKKATRDMAQKLAVGDQDLADELMTISLASREKKKTLITGSALNDVAQNIIEKSITGEIEPAIKFDWTEFSKMSGGFRKQDLVIIAARPSMGKTAFAINLLSQMLKNNLNCVFFSLEMPSSGIAMRMISKGANVNAKKLFSGDVSEEEADRIAYFMARNFPKDNFYISEAQGDINLIRAQVAQVAAKLGRVDAILVDYIGLIASSEKKFQNREREVAQLSLGLKQIAREQNCVVVALSQLNRGTAARQDPTPFMSDLRDSGSLEQDADQIILLHRPGYYAEKDKEDKDIDPELTKVIIAKNRNGETGAVDFIFQKDRMSFKEVSSHEK